VKLEAARRRDSRSQLEYEARNAPVYQILDADTENAVTENAGTENVGPVIVKTEGSKMHSWKMRD